MQNLKYTHLKSLFTVINVLKTLKADSHAPNLLASIIYSRVNIIRVYYLRMRTQILKELNLLASKFTPGFDQTQKYIKFYSRKYFKVSCHANANYIYS